MRNEDMMFIEASLHKQPGAGAGRADSLLALPYRPG
jgi:hypothetical protein